MIVFLFVAVGYLLGHRVADVLRRRGAPRPALGTAVLVCLAVCVLAGIVLLWVLNGIDASAALSATYGFLASLAGGTLAGLVVAAVVVVAVLGVLCGIWLSLRLVMLAFLALLDGVGDGHDGPQRPAPTWLSGGHALMVDRGGGYTVDSVWRSATCSYGRAVAEALHAEVGGDVRLDVQGIVRCSLRLETEGIAARWDFVEGWSAMTLRGRHWYDSEQVPVPDRIVRWLREIGTTPRVGAGAPRRWRPDDEQAEQNTLTQLFEVAAPRESWCRPDRGGSGYESPPAPESRG